VPTVQIKGEDVNRTYASIRDPSVLIDLFEVEKFVKDGQFINLIKEYRKATGLGLRESKEAIESHKSPNGFDVDAVLNMFKQHLEIADPLTKTEFLNIIEGAIDNMEKFYYGDMLEAVMALCDNIKKRGGLNMLVEEREKFIRAI